MITGQRRWPDIRFRDRRAVNRTLRRTTWGVHAPEVEVLRAAMADYCGTTYALLTDSGTSALVCGLTAIGAGPGKEVITSAFSFSASATAIMETGATPVFTDIRPDTGTIDPRQVEAAITPNTCAILAVAVHGHFCDTRELERIARRHDISLAWDICQAIGARDEIGRIAGSVGEFSAISGNVTKPWQCGEGGVLVTNTFAVHHCAKLSACFGEDRVPLEANQERSYWSRFLGTNARMSALTASLGHSQLCRLDRYIERARRNLGYLQEGIGDIPGVRVLSTPPDAAATPWHPRVVLDPGAHGWDGEPTEFRDRIISAIAARGLAVGTWQLRPLPASPVFRGHSSPAHIGMAPPPLKPWEPDRYPVASKLLDASLVIGLYPHPLYVQPQRVMRRYVDAFHSVFGNLGAALSGDFTRIEPVPPIPADDL